MWIRIILWNFLCLHDITLNIHSQYRKKINLLLLSIVTPGVGIYTNIYFFFAEIYTNILISHFLFDFIFFLVGAGYSILFCFIFSSSGWLFYFILFYFSNMLDLMVFFFYFFLWGSISWLLKTTWSFFKLWLLVINVTKHGISGLLWLLVINVTNHGIGGLCLSFNKYILTSSSL